MKWFIYPSRLAFMEPTVLAPIFSRFQIRLKWPNDHSFLSGTVLFCRGINTFPCVSECRRSGASTYDVHRILGSGLGLSFRVQLPDLVTSANFGSSRVGFLGSFQVEMAKNVRPRLREIASPDPLMNILAISTRNEPRKWLADQSIQVELGSGRSSAWTEPTWTD